MPLYEYICQECGERFEKLIRSSTNADKVVCPSCASAVVKRAFSTFATTGGSAEHLAPACGPIG